MTIICAEIPSNERIYCRTCRNPVSRVQDYIWMVHPGGIFSRVYNVLVSDDVNYHFGSTIANTYCGQCGTMIGWKFIEVPRWYEYVREGRFILILSELSFWNGVSLLHLGANEQNADQDGDSTDQYEDANEQNVDQDGDASTLRFVLLLSVATFWNGVPLPHLNEEQDLGANEENAHQDGNATTIRFLLFLSVVTFWNSVPLPHLNEEQDLGANEQNAHQDGDSTDQNEDANEQNTEQDLGVNEQNVDQDGDSTDQNKDANEQNADQDLGVNEENTDQDGGGNEQNHDSDGRNPMN